MGLKEPFRIVRIMHANQIETSHSFFDDDFALFQKGRDELLYQKLGAHLIDGGVRFSVWAPSASSVYLASEGNEWPMVKVGESGVWTVFVHEAKEGMIYKYAIEAADGSKILRADPFGYAAEMRPNNSSIVADLGQFTYSDERWLEKRKNAAHKTSPVNIYEVHLGSWRRKDHTFMNYREMAPLLAQYVKEMGYTHVELMPITEHPLDESWGYQVTGYFAPTSRFGTPQDFQFFVDTMHQHDIAVILDWVGAHFPTDMHALVQFDGTHLFEYEDKQKGFHPQWNTLIFDYGKPQVANFLIASVLFWADLYHIDGFRFDAVSSILYLSYAREEGQWSPNEEGGAENLEAIAFLKRMNETIHRKHPGIMTIAEEATVFPKVSHPDGLGFDFKSNLGWMNDTLRFFETEPQYRHHKHDLITFYLVYAYHEHYALFLSHDEVVHEKKSLISKMPGEQKDQFANLRLLYTMMMTLPGKKLMFMGGEFGQWNEWNEGEELHWFLLDYPTHQGVHRCVKAINHFYLSNESLWQLDHERQGFEWVAHKDKESLVVAYLRKSEKKKHIVVHNFSHKLYNRFHIDYHGIKTIREVFNSEHETFMGMGEVNEAIVHNDQGFEVNLAPFVTSILEVS